MKVKVFTLRLDPATGRFDDRELVEFQESREVLDVSEYQFVHERTPTWAVLVRYRDASRPVGSREGEPRKDWRAELDPGAQVLYDSLRDWRATRAHREGAPPYLILTNREMAAVAARRPMTKAALSEIPGIGESKVERFSDELFAIVAAFPPLAGSNAASSVSLGRPQSGTTSHGG